MSVREDELHFAFECPLYNDLRLDYLDRVPGGRGGVSVNKCMNGIWRKKNAEAKAHTLGDRMVSFICQGMVRSDQYIMNQQQMAAF
jgi:hypothetical protein